MPDGKPPAVFFLEDSRTAEFIGCMLTFHQSPKLRYGFVDE